MIVFSCPKCQKKLSVQNDVAGKKARCPGCGQVLIVPEPAPLPIMAKSAGVGTADMESEAITQGDDPQHLATRSMSTTPAVSHAPVPSDNLELTRDVTGSLEATAAHGVGHKNRGEDAELWSFLGTPEKPDEIGRLGPYRVLRVLGSGGMGVVFHAEDIHLGRAVALKAMRPALASSSSGKDRFKLEAKAAATIKHPRVVAIHQVGEERGTVFLAMEYLEGESLESRLRR